MLTRPLSLLRLEGAALFLTALALYGILDAPWWLFALLLFAPDLAMLGYLAGPRVGAALYNLAHLTALPLVLLPLSLWLGLPAALPWALVWLAHIGLDRALGYGLKLPAGFKETHLGPIGREG